MYCLRWNSYKNNICNGFAQLQQREEFVDMTIVAEGHLVNVHKNLISLASPYIKNVIKSVPCKHPIIFLSNITHDVLCQLLEYIYTGEVHVEIDKLNDFIKAAKELQLPSITNDLLHETLSEERSNNTQKDFEENIEEKRQKIQHVDQNNIENCRLDGATSDAANTTRANDNIILDIDMELSQNINDHILPHAISLINGQSTNIKETIPLVEDIKLDNRLQDNGTSAVAIDTNKMIKVLDTKIIPSQNNHHYDYSNSIIVTEVDNANNFDEFLKFPDPHNSTATVREHSMPDQQIQELEGMDHNKKAQIDLSLECGTNSLPQQYTVSNRGSLQMVLNRYVYNMHYSAYGGVKRRWRCIDYRFLRCGAFVDTHNDEIIKRKNCHTHPFHDNKIMKKIKANLIFGAISTAINQSKKYSYMEDSVSISDSDG